MAHLGAEVNRVASADLLHYDVMDNHFVPNLSFGFPVLESLVKVSPIPIDVHLMIEDPDYWAPKYGETGVASVTFHAEAVKAPVRLARELRGIGVKAAIALRPATPIEPYIDMLHEFDMVLVMTVEPGFGGQGFIESMLPKIARTRAAIDASGSKIRLQVDGGISRATIEQAAQAGADTFVAGTAVFGADDVPSEVEVLRNMAHSACVGHN